MKCGPGSHLYKINHVRMRLFKKKKDYFCCKHPKHVRRQSKLKIWNLGLRVADTR